MATTRHTIVKPSAASLKKKLPVTPIPPSEPSEPENAPVNISNLPSITKKQLHMIAERVLKQQKNSSIEKKSPSISPNSSKKKPSKPVVEKTKFTVECKNDNERKDYSLKKELMRSTIRTLTEQTPHTMGGKRWMFFDSYNGTPCPFFTFSIPENSVGIAHKTKLVSSSDDFFGAFCCESTMIGYLRDVLKCPKEHVLVQNCAEYYGFEKKLDTFYDNPDVLTRVNDQRCMGGAKNAPQVFQGSKSAKTVKHAWYFSRPGVAISQTMNTINTDSVLDDLGLSNQFQSRNDDHPRFNTYEDYLQEKQRCSDQKKATADNNKEWMKLIEERGIDTISELVENTLKQGKTTGKKRKFEEINKPSEELGEILSSIANKIALRNATDYFEDLSDNSTDSEELEEDLA